MKFSADYSKLQNRLFTPIRLGCVFAWGFLPMLASSWFIGHLIGLVMFIGGSVWVLLVIAALEPRCF